MKENIDAKSFKEDLEIVSSKDPDVKVLETNAGRSLVLVSPGFQGKVFTSSTEGLAGRSIGWVSRDAILADSPDPQINAFGGENRFWIGPEGSRNSIFVSQGKEFVFENWKTPPPIDSEHWKLENSDNENVWMSHEMKILNRVGTVFDIKAERIVSLLSPEKTTQMLNIEIDSKIEMVAYSTKNIISNLGNDPWTEESGTVCIWILDMFSPSEKTVILLPHKPLEPGIEKVITTDYFGPVNPDRLKQENELIFFKADGNSRGKIGVNGSYALPWAASYDPTNSLFTLITFDIDERANYLNQEWNDAGFPYNGDAVNAYNDGPLINGGQLGPFYELESSSPGAFLQPGESACHSHNVFHFTGEHKYLDKLVSFLTGQTIKKLSNIF